MRKPRYIEEQTGFALKQAETDTPVVEVIRLMAVSQQTFHRWKGARRAWVGELRRVEQLDRNPIRHRLLNFIRDHSIEVGVESVKPMSPSTAPAPDGG